MTQPHLQIVLLTCAKSILPSTFLRAAIAERFRLASQARCGSVWDHRNGRFDGFTAKYAVKALVWYEHHHSMEDAIRREKRIKKWNRA